LPKECNREHPNKQVSSIVHDSGQERRGEERRGEGRRGGRRCRVHGNALVVLVLYRSLTLSFGIPTRTLRWQVLWFRRENKMDPQDCVSGGTESLSKDPIAEVLHY